MSTTSTPSIFISYRRDDSAGHAGRLSDRLEQRFGRERVFRDIEDIAAGEDFVVRLERQVADCQVLLALIGPRWLAPGPTGRPRLFDEQDWVRREIAHALCRGVRVIPVLLQGATMPGAEALPPDLAPLARHNAMELREAQFDRDAEHLASVLAPADRRARWRRVAVAASLIAVAAGGAYGGYHVWDNTPARAKQRLHQQGLVFDDATFVSQAAEGHAAEVRLFLRGGQDVEVEGAEGHTALELATAFGHVDVVDVLLDAGALPDEALVTAAREPSDEIFDRLMLRRPGIEALNAALPGAAAMGRVARMERLVSAGAKVDGGNRRALRDAALNVQVSALRWLIDHGSRVDGPFEPDGETVLHVASGATIPNDAVGDPVTDALTVLLNARADPNAVRGPGNGLLSTPLLIAAYFGREGVAQLLLARGAKPDLPSSEGSASTPLMVAAEYGHPALVRLLLDRDAAIDAADTSGETALMMATRRGAHDTMDVLLQHGANVNARDKHGLTALMLAVDTLDVNTVSRLLDANADIDATAANGWTALMRLASRPFRPDSLPARNAAAVAQRLIQQGARAERRNSKGEDARTLAQESGAPPELLAVLDLR